MSMSNSGQKIAYAAAFMGYGAVGLGFIYPEITASVVRGIMNDFNNGRDATIQLLDKNADSCIRTPLQHDFCVSVGGYLKAIISETPLTQEETENLPSFIGEPYPASPFSFSI